MALEISWEVWLEAIGAATTMVDPPLPSTTVAVGCSVARGGSAVRTNRAVVEAACEVAVAWTSTRADQPADGEIDGWAGDLLSLLNAYQGALDAWNAGTSGAEAPGTLSQYVTAALFVDDGAFASPFGLSDYVEDCIGDLLARDHLAQPTATFPALLRAVYSYTQPRDTVFTQFKRARVGVSSADTEALGINTLSGPVDSAFDALRIALLAAGSPHVALGQFALEERTRAGEIFGERVNALANGVAPGDL